MVRLASDELAEFLQPVAAVDRGAVDVILERLAFVAVHARRDLALVDSGADADGLARKMAPGDRRNRAEDLVQAGEGVVAGLLKPPLLGADPVEPKPYSSMARLAASVTSGLAASPR